MARFDIRVTPRSSKNRIAVDQAGVIRVYVTAAPVDGAANAATTELLAKRLGISKSSVAIVKGESSRDKTVQVEGLSAEEAAAKLTDQNKLL